MPKKYLFADESGNFDFRDHQQFKNGPTKFFAVGTLMIEGERRMRSLRDDLMDLRYTLVENGTPHHESFHATEDPQHVRDAVFDVLRGHDFKVDVTILEKSKSQPQTRTSPARFYKYAWFYHFKHFSGRYFQPSDELMVVSAGLGNKRTKSAFKDSVEDVVRQCCNYQVKRDFGFWPCAADPCLQAADYALWAVMRDVERKDSRSRDLIDDKINSVYNLWSWGDKHYYGSKATKPKSA